MKVVNIPICQLDLMNNYWSEKEREREKRREVIARWIVWKMNRKIRVSQFVKIKSHGVEKGWVGEGYWMKNRKVRISQLVEGGQQPTDTSKQPIRTSYLGHVTGYQPIRHQYFLIRAACPFVKFSNHLTARTTTRIMDRHSQASSPKSAKTLGHHWSYGEL